MMILDKSLLNLFEDKQTLKNLFFIDKSHCGLSNVTTPIFTITIINIIIIFYKCSPCGL